MKRPGFAVWLLLGMALVASMGGTQHAWAIPGQDPLHQTVPTRTPFRSPTPIPPATAEPSDTPALATQAATSVRVPATATSPAHSLTPGVTATSPAALSTVPAFSTATQPAAGTEVPAGTPPAPAGTSVPMQATLEGQPALAATPVGSLQVSLRADRFAVWEGQPITLTLQVTNTGTTQVQGLAVRLSWPAELSPITISGECVLANPGSSEIRFQDLAPSAQPTCTLSSRVLSTASHGKVLLLGGEAQWQGGQVRIQGDQIGLPPAELPIVGGKP